MSKAFREAFPTLKLEEELEGLLDTTEVTKISANHEHTHIRIYLRAKRLIFKKTYGNLKSDYRTDFSEPGHTGKDHRVL